MFNGIVEAIGEITKMSRQGECVDFAISTTMNCNDIKVGDSVAVNGVCLTVTDCSQHTFSMTVVPETLRVTNLGELVAGDIVNLEKSLPVNGHIDGHIVQGHVDGVGKIVSLEADGNRALLAKISIPNLCSQYIVNKGYIALDGMSITVIHADIRSFTVTFIPHTQDITIVNRYRVGTHINIEVDILGKYVDKLIGANKNVNSC